LRLRERRGTAHSIVVVVDLKSIRLRRCERGKGQGGGVRDKLDAGEKFGKVETTDAGERYGWNLTNWKEN